MPDDMNSGEEEQGFKVSDRRFSVRGYEDSEEETGSGAEPEPPERAPAAEEAPSETPPPPVPEPEAAGEDPGGEPPAAGEVPREFETLVAILQANAVAAMGLNPQTGERVGGADPRTAKLFVDMIAMVKEKMAGNLSPAEDQILTQVISDLKMMYVQQVGVG